MKKNKTITIRFDELEYKELKLASDSTGIPITQLLRQGWYKRYNELITSGELYKKI